MRSYFNRIVQSVRDKKGVALLMVLTTIALLTTAIVDFSYNTSLVNYRLAIHNRNRLQAYYLAKSGLNFSKLLLKYNKEAEALMKKARDSGAEVNIEPIYRLFPLSSGLLRGVANDPSLISQFGVEKKTDKPAEEEELADKKEEKKKSIDMMKSKETQEFLDFEGDFDVEILEEQSKINLNVISSYESGSPAYDLQKKIIWSVLQLPAFEDFFKNPVQDSLKLTHALGDWVDLNNTINEFDNVQRGREESIYEDRKTRIKNGKFLTFSEVRLVEGVSEDIFNEMKKYFTVYGNQGKINACLAGEDVLKALILYYANNSGCSAPLRDEDERKIKELTTDVKNACPDTSAMTQALNTGLGIGDLSSPSEAGKGGGGKVSGCLFQFSDLITSDNTVFTVKSTGLVDETRVTITSVFSTSQGKPSNWKYYYYKIR